MTRRSLISGNPPCQPSPLQHLQESPAISVKMGEVIAQSWDIEAASISQVVLASADDMLLEGHKHSDFSDVLSQPPQISATPAKWSAVQIYSSNTVSVRVRILRVFCRIPLCTVV